MASFTRSFCLCINLPKRTLNISNISKRLMTSFFTTADQFRLLKNSESSSIKNYCGRSIWYWAPSISKNFKSTVSSSTGVSCMCGSFHSKTDAAFSNALVNEIKDERERMAGIPEPSAGWSLKQDGTSCTLTKTIDNDRIEVSFNVNGSISPATSDDPEENEDIIAQPDFLVDIKKPSSPITLSFDCFYPQQEQDLMDDNVISVYGIRSVMAYEGEINQTKYVIETENIDPNVYEHMITYLQNRGVTNQLAEEIIGIATAVENEEYITTLERLQNFVSCD